VKPPMPSFRVHSLPQAIAALTAADEAGVAVTLWSPARALGPGYILAMLQAARAAIPAARALAVQDCGDAPGLALGALRMGAEAVCVDASPETLDKLADIAARHGARLMPREDACDLSPAFDPLAAARRFLGLA